MALFFVYIRAPRTLLHPLPPQPSVILSSKFPSGKRERRKDNEKQIHQIACDIGKSSSQELDASGIYNLVIYFSW